MKLPFTPEQFLEAFVRYNAAVWPAPLLLATLALAAIYFACRPARHSDRLISGILATLWLWAGIVYHIGFFAEINPLARWFGVLFVAQAVGFLTVGTIANRLVFRPQHGRFTAVGALLMGYSLFAYPVLNFLFGHGWPQMPTFGAPCPITIFTLGFLLWTNLRASPHLAFVPVLWALAGMAAALTLDVYEDSVLAVAAAMAISKIISRRHSTAMPLACGMGVDPSALSPAPENGTTCHEK